jgi:hypothetical protein
VQLLHLWDEIALLHEKYKQLFGTSQCIISLDVDPYAMSTSFPEGSNSKQALVAAIWQFTDIAIAHCHSLPSQK